MNLSARILGTSTADKLQRQATGIILKIGKDTFTKRSLADIDCFNFLAAQRLSALLQDFGVTSTQDVFDHVSPMMLAIPKLGAISLAVLGAAFEAKGLGGAHPLEAWVLKHADAQHQSLTTFATFKHRAKDMEAERRTKADRRRAKTRQRIQTVKAAKTAAAF
jgi:hypothetical protein